MSDVVMLGARLHEVLATRDSRLITYWPSNTKYSIHFSICSSKCQMIDIPPPRKPRPSPPFVLYLEIWTKGLSPRGRRNGVQPNDVCNHRQSHSSV